MWNNNSSLYVDDSQTISFFLSIFFSLSLSTLLSHHSLFHSVDANILLEN